MVRKEGTRIRHKHWGAWHGRMVDLRPARKILSRCIFLRGFVVILLLELSRSNEVTLFPIVLLYSLVSASPSSSDIPLHVFICYTSLTSCPSSSPLALPSSTHIRCRTLLLLHDSVSAHQNASHTATCAKRTRFPFSSPSRESLRRASSRRPSNTQQQNCGGICKLLTHTNEVPGSS